MATLDSRRGRSFDPAAPIAHEHGQFLTGLGPGLYAGVVMGIVLGIVSLARGIGVFQPFRVVASAVLGSRALHDGPWGALCGVGMHLAFAALLGMAFTRIFGRTTMRRLLAFGLFYGLFLWLVAQFVLLPWLAPAFAMQLGSMWTFFLGHLAYGLTLASAVPSVKDIDAPVHAYIDPLHREVRP